MEETRYVTCYECSKDFRHEFFLRKHQLAYHDTTPFNCDECGVEVLGKKTLINHKRVHQINSSTKSLPRMPRPKATKTEQTYLCEKCNKSFKRRYHLERHKSTHNGPDKFICNECEKEFGRNDNLEKHVRTVHATKKKGKGSVLNANFEKTKPDVVKNDIVCKICLKTFQQGFNLKRHMKKQHKSRWTTMRNIKKMLADREYAERLRNKLPSSEEIDETFIETVMTEMPNLSNRQILQTLTLLRTTLPKKHFKKNLKQAIQKRTNLLNGFFVTVDSKARNSQGEEIEVPVTSAKDLNTLIHLVCEKRDLKEDEIKVVFGIDGGQEKLIATMAVVPNDEGSKEERRAEEEYSKRSKSTGCKKCLVVSRLDNVPENRDNVKVLIDRLNLPDLQKDFCVMADIKLIDILCGIQSTSSIHPCPYCNGVKVDSAGKETNGNGTWVKGTPRTGKSLREEAEQYQATGFPNRQTLRHFDSVEFPPLFIHPNQEELLVSQIYPPPQLHTGILGPGNDVMVKLTKDFPKEMEVYKKKFHIKGSGPGNTLNGPMLKKLMANHNGMLSELGEMLKTHGKPDHQLFVEHLHNLGQLNILVNMKELHLDLIDSAIKEIGRVFKLLQEHFQMSMTLKMHIILHHYLDHFEVTGETLLKYTDEAVEAMHSQIKQFEERHHYKNHKYGSCSKAHSQHKSTVHINSLNLGDVKRKRKINNKK